MTRYRSRDRRRIRMQRWVACIVLFSMILSGLAVYATLQTQPSSQQPIQQSTIRP